MNLLGNDNLTISGTKFPYDLTTSTVQINFTDAGTTGCIPQWSNSTELVCLTQEFDPSLAGTSVGMTIIINGQTVSNTLSLTFMSDTKSGIQFNPPTASPVLKTKINITLESSFPYTLARDEFTVNATNISNPTYFRQMNVIGVDDANKVLTVMFGGAWSGDYFISIRHKAYGLVNTRGLTFTVGSNVTNVTPLSGSIYGGTLLTITGTNFGTEKTDNPVSVTTLGGVGAVHCYVQTTNSTHITCRVDKTNKTA